MGFLDPVSTFKECHVSTVDAFALALEFIFSSQTEKYCNAFNMSWKLWNF